MSSKEECGCNGGINSVIVEGQLQLKGKRLVTVQLAAMATMMGNKQNKNKLRNLLQPADLHMESETHEGMLGAPQGLLDHKPAHVLLFILVCNCVN